MIEYEINGRRAIVHEGRPFIEAPTTESEPPVIKDDAEEETRPRKARTPKAKRAKAVLSPGRKKRVCGNCGKPGHTIRTCPKASGTDVEVEDTGLGENEIRERVIEMQALGRSSLAVARELKIPLKKVNEYWQQVCGRCGMPGHEYPHCADLEAKEVEAATAEPAP